MFLPVLLHDSSRQHWHAFDEHVLNCTVVHELHNFAGGDSEAAASLSHSDDLSRHRSYLQEDSAYLGPHRMDSAKG